MTHYHHIPESSVFSRAVHSFWQVGGLTYFHDEHIVPKGVVEVIFNFSDSESIATQPDTKSYNLGRCFINGFNTAPIKVQLPKQRIYFGIVLQPLAVKKLFGIPAAEFSNKTVDLSLISSNYSHIWHQLAEVDDFSKRVSLFLKWVETKTFDWQPQEKLLNGFLYGNENHELTVKELAHTVCYSTRHLSRKLFEATGMNTEEMLLYKKYLHAVELIHHTELSLTAIAYQCHFTDQSHFIKTFKSYTQFTPGEYRRKKSPVKGHIYENVR